ncbi:unnamed protein product, partial [Discosporangium mesarthrocarpum]
EVPSISCTSYCKWAVKSGIPLSSLWRLCKRVGGRKHKRWVKPMLSDMHKHDRVGFALSHMHRKGGARVVVDDMYDWIHVDEMWFYVMKDGRGIYLHPEEDAPKPPRAQNKRFITKVMFLAAVARPRMTSDGVWFDGKIRIWPIAGTVAAMGSSKNRKKGTVMLKPGTINAETYEEPMIDKVIPCNQGEDAWTQVTRRKGGVMEAIQAKAGDSIILKTQPANSPDLSVNDLAFFQSIQQLKEDVGVCSPEGLVEAIMEAFNVCPWETLERAWQSLFAVLGEVLGSKGDNSYKLPHLGKEDLHRTGKLPVN